MYPLAPVSRMSEVLGIADGFAANLFAAKVSALFISDLSPRLGPLERGGDATPTNPSTISSSCSS